MVWEINCATLICLEGWSCYSYNKIKTQMTQMLSNSLLLQEERSNTEKAEF